MADDQRLARKLPGEIRMELITVQDGFMTRVKEIVEKFSPTEGKALAWSESLRKYLADGDAMIVSARIGRTLVGFLVLEPETATASFSWVSEQARDRGLGQRFYSFACIHLAMPTPQFIFPKDLLDEYRPVLKQQGLQPRLKDAYYVVHERPEALDAA